MHKTTAKQAWLKRLNSYWSSSFKPVFKAHRGEVFEIDFGYNIGDEFGGRHLAVCVEDSESSDTMMRVIPLSTQTERYGLREVEYETNLKFNFRAGLVAKEIRNISKLRVYRKSVIIPEFVDNNNISKGFLLNCEESL